MGHLLKYCVCAMTLAFTSPTFAHDSWVQTNTHIVRTGEPVYVDLMMGNHGNEHRDFKLAGKVDIESSTLELVDPDGATRDLRPALTDQGLDPRGEYWSARLGTSKPGLYIVAHTSDKVVSYAPKRSVKSAKTLFIASDSLDSVPTIGSGYDRVFGHAFELVPVVNPVAPMGPGERIKVKLLYQGKPLADAHVAFIPRGATLKEGVDEKYERTTDENGLASFEPGEANLYLVVAHHEDSALTGEGFTSTKFSATLTVWVPALCPCCD